ncbi:PorP/SprF family type IX secretion system membrane protein [Carboxylicivirga mesophila]|uniref:PorP/SprF family type IX secretion system membrane protein n=1 Tax=Carboxylicivirga mesophila TaxID=1166478 RepID=A0ABS5K670_9BACT|nr:type IX secretion system membrane protein PorP/SprF [Carboxylicivirga mesophila]MBS2210489.1 PorP/SprF family type IX secretion system membrane protein [Carboxylicivirga mesophila]
MHTFERILSYLIKSTFVLFCLLSISVRAQDVSFSQMYATPMYLSPSFTGLTQGTRMSLTYRDQWPGIAKAYRSYALAADHFFDQYSSGLGIMVLRDDSGNGLLVRQDISALYAYEIEIARDIYVRPGIEFIYKERNLSLLDAIFPSDQGDGGVALPSAGSGNSEYNHKQFDAAASAMIYNDNFWFGFAMHNLVKSNVGVTDIETYNPFKTSVYGGYKYRYKDKARRNDEQSITLAFNYRLQQNFNQLDIGTYWYINPMELGLWYRGIPFASNGGLINNDGLIFILGINVGPARLAYSYDWTLSELSGYSNGANELSVIYRFNQSVKKHKSRGAIPCSAPGYSGSGSKYRRKTRSFF